MIEGPPPLASNLGAAALLREGCDLMQGYHFAPPLAADEFARRLRG